MERRWTLRDNAVFPLDESAIDLSSPGHILVPSQQEICLNPTYLKTDMFGTHPASGTHKSCLVRDVGLRRKTPALQEELKKNILDVSVVQHTFSTLYRQAPGK